MTVQLSSSGTIDEIMDTDAFIVHDSMFNIRDAIQVLFLCSKTMYDFFNSTECNLFVISIKPSSSCVMGTPMSTNNKFNECVMRNNADIDTPQSEVHYKKNTYTYSDGKYLLFVTKGYILDNFIVKESYHDFRLNERDPYVIIYADDIESLTLKNPNLG